MNWRKPFLLQRLKAGLKPRIPVWAVQYPHPPPYAHTGGAKLAACSMVWRSSVANRGKCASVFACHDLAASSQEGSCYTNKAELG